MEDEEAARMLHDVEVRQMVTLLPEPLQSVISHIYWLDRSVHDTARLLQISDRAVRLRLERAYALLKKTIDVSFEHGDPPEHAVS
jgi:DNA-directed RNA polymerase specialized sigma24 family protein